MAVPSSVTTSWPATIGASGEANGVRFKVPDFTPSGNGGVTKVRVSGTYGTTTIVVEARLRGMSTYLPVAGVDAKTTASVGTGGSIALTDNTGYEFRFPTAFYDELVVYASALGSGTLTVEQASGPAEAVSPPVVNATTTTTSLAAATTVTSTSASALTVGANGATNPVLKVDASTGSVATGVSVTGAAAGSRVAVAAISSGTNEGLDLNAKGSGTIRIGNSSTGAVQIGGSAATVLPGTLTAGGLLTCALQVATSGPLIYSGSGAPSISAAVKGSIYLRSDGSSTSTRLYVATDNAGTWTPVTTAA